jgi:prepilin-type N-terminal cleavage/methylation domain-containing protein
VDVKGFTLIEMVVVIAMIGMLAAALPLVTNAKEYSHEAALIGTGGAIAAAVALVHAQWIANGHVKGDEIDDLRAFGNEEMNMTVEGWPRGISGLENSASMDVTQCVEVWRGLLKVGAPSVATDVGSDYLVTAVSDVNGKSMDCLFTYQHDSATNTIRYDADEGVVTTTIL